MDVEKDVDEDDYLRKKSYVVRLPKTTPPPPPRRPIFLAIL